MENVKKLVIAEINTRYDYDLADEKERQRALGAVGRWKGYGPAAEYKGATEAARTAKLRAALDRKRAEDIAAKIKHIEDVKAAPERLDRALIIRIEWTKSRTWGYTAKASDNFGRVSGVASGCGYDKASTVTADILNENRAILRRLYLVKNASGGGKTNEDLFGYGVAGTLPHFSGGVGVSCHVRALERLGFAVEWGNDVMVITEKA